MYVLLTVDYESHLEYQYAKIELINNYMEVFEHTVDLDKSLNLVQMVVDTIHTKPVLDFENEYFSKSYAFATQALVLQSNLVEDSLHHVLEKQREWTQRYAMVSGMKDLDSEASVPYKTTGFQPSHNDASGFSSSFEIGLPRVSNIQLSQTVIMHHPGMLVDMTEIVPACENVINIWHNIKKITQEVAKGIENSSGPGSTFSQLSVECIVLKTMRVFISYSRNIGTKWLIVGSRHPFDKGRSMNPSICIMTFTWRTRTLLTSCLILTTILLTTQKRKTFSHLV